MPYLKAKLREAGLPEDMAYRRSSRVASPRRR